MGAQNLNSKVQLEQIAATKTHLHASQRLGAVNGEAELVEGHGGDPGGERGTANQKTKTEANSG